MRTPAFSTFHQPPSAAACESRSLFAASHVRGRCSRVADVRMQQVTQMAGAAKAAAAVMEEVSRSVGTNGIEAPDMADTFVSIDAERTGLVDEEGLPLVYDKQAIQKYWEGQGGALQQRWIEFLSVSVPFLTRVATLLVSGGADALQANSAGLAKDARERIEKLGPTYVKMGQMMSVRPDVLPQEALNELVALQDGVEGFDSQIAVKMIEQELGRPLDEVFDDFSMEPAAAASLAQVYRARLRESGEWVAVKVQRPGVQALVSKDLYVLRRAAEVYQGLVSRFAPQQRTDYVALLNEWAVGFYTELDFQNEASNMKRMQQVLLDSSVTDVVVPRVYDSLTTRRLLVSQWIDGKKLSDCSPEEVRELIKVGQECFLVQLLQAGFFHSDPHPGNLIRPNDQSIGKLALIDFGLVAQVRQEDMDSMVSAIIHLANKDYAALVDDFISLKILPADCNRAKVVPLMDKALSPYVKGGGAKRYEEELKKMYGFEESGAVGGFQAMTQDMLTVLNDIPFSIPPYFALLARAVVTLEGLALSVDPDYGLVIEAYPFVARKLLSEDRPELQRALQQVLYSGPNNGGAGLTPARLAALLNSAAGIVAKQDGAVFVDLDAVPESGISLSQALSFLLSPSAGSIRKLLADEAFTAADLLLRQAMRKSVPAIASALPQPPRVPLPFIPPPPDPMQLQFPLFLPPQSGGSFVPPRLTTASELLDIIAPRLTREEELYAISLVDLARTSLGEDAASLIAGDLAAEPVTASRVLLPLLAAVVEESEGMAGIAAAAPLSGSNGGGADVGKPGGGRSALSLLVRNAANLLESVPTSSRASRGVDAATAQATAEIRDAIKHLTPTQRREMQELVSDLTTKLRARLDERLLAIR
mmetsp:Transcript_2976/g.5815  ORF Transcript_2976/g.5815 Transcript_2976/m.5815 type:complete len:874 (-) Transcript_2976:290-2911(-)